MVCNIFYIKPIVKKAFTYTSSSFYSQDLHAINTMVSCEVGGVTSSLGALGVKRGAEAGGDVVKRARLANAHVARKLQGLMTDRQAV